MGSIGCLAAGSAGALPGPATRLLQLALGNCRRLIGIVNDILDIERIESGNLPYAHRPVEVCELVDQAIEANLGMAAQYGVRLRLADPSAKAAVFADPEALRVDDLIDRWFAPEAQTVLTALVARLKSKG